MLLASLWVRLGLRGKEEVKGGLNETRRAIRETKNEAKAGKADFDTGLSLPMLDAAYAAHALTAGLGATAAAFASASGVGKAAAFKDIELSLGTVTGSAQEAIDLLKELKQIGKESTFDTTEIARLTPMLINSGTAARNASKEMRNLLDFAAYNQLSRNDLPEFIRNIGQIRRAPTPDLQDLKDLVQRAPGVGRILGAGMGRGPMNGGEAIKAMQGMSGQEVYETLIKGTEALAKGADAMRALQSPTAALGNLLETLGQIMEPTGQILLRVLMPVAGGLKFVADGLQKVNEVTSGGAGLAAGVFLLYRGKNLLIGSFIMAVSKTRELTAAITGYSMAASAATAASKAKGAADVVAGVASVAGSGALSAAARAKLAADPWGLRASAEIAANAGRFGKVGMLGRGLLGFLKSGLGVGLVAELGLGFAGDAVGSMGGRKSNIIGDLLKNLGTGIGTGATLGSVIPGLGTLTGALVGAISGAGISLYNVVRGGYNKAGAGGDPQTDATRENTKAIRELTGNLLGGGERARSAESIMEADAAMGRLFMTGWA